MRLSAMVRCRYEALSNGMRSAWYEALSNGMRSAPFGNQKRHIVCRGESGSTVAFDEECF